MVVQTLISSRGTPLLIYRKGPTRSEEIEFLCCHYKPGIEYSLGGSALELWHSWRLTSKGLPGCSGI